MRRQRFCVDYSKLNAIAKTTSLRIDDTLDTLSFTCWFSTLDMVSGYWQIEVGEKDMSFARHIVVCV